MTIIVIAVPVKFLLLKNRLIFAHPYCLSEDTKRRYLSIQAICSRQDDKLCEIEQTRLSKLKNGRNLHFTGLPEAQVDIMVGVGQANNSRSLLLRQAGRAAWAFSGGARAPGGLDEEWMASRRSKDTCDFPSTI